MSDYSIARRNMVDRQLKARGIKDPRVLAAVGQIPRHLFVEDAFASQAYGDFPLPIGEKQTISQPYMVGLMSEALLLTGKEKVLEIGTGSGYQAAVLAKLAGRVFSVERIPALARRARRILDGIGCGSVNIKVTDGTLGWEEEAPFDAIVVTAGAPSVPDCYLRQLAIGGRLVIPVGDMGVQVLKRITRVGENNFSEEQLVDCRFVPLLGKLGWREEA
ncbi:protein-L-isoaspartate(D-aspartate) O-methyltransferase [Trichloromonas acetexigens]|uniref:Protein-L-isoaspartate O-methyltransferase n=1 Tax=Trichloromonas acetexigens TaxID=38815 RepID=A0A550JKU7_9BACT|nr:protein-L-isoaspartate(D-aspartate) O-methyltransferase [Desulfuromonas acetexigens]TRO83846.1 protein-L-isoaspartate(D-aspartate) O-methyltransferase [Desulfuromonas acetexigens]